MDSGDPSSSRNVHNDCNGVNALVSSYCICYIIPSILVLGENVKKDTLNSVQHTHDESIP